MKGFRSCLLKAAFALLLLAAAGCAGVLGGDSQPTPVEEGTPVIPTPTPDLAGYQNQSGRACQVAQYEILRSIQVDNRSMAWSPDGTQLAYLAPTLLHRWFLGDLALLSGENYSEKSILAENAIGGVSWSPEGNLIGFTGLRPQEKLQTTLVIRPSGGSPRDLFPGADAQTDNFSSPKTIVSWPSENRLYVQAGCGDGCTKLFEVNPTSGSAREVAGDRVSLPRPRSYDEEAFPAMVTPAWSSDGQRVAFFDDDGRLWVMSVEEHLATEITIDGYTPVDIYAPDDQELTWSSAGQLAIRLDDRLAIYNFPCQGQ